MAISLGPADNSDELDEMAEINTTPLIDVMLVLLIMLIITIPVQNQSVDLHLPTTKTEQPPVPPTIILIDLDAAGGIKWDGRQVDDSQSLNALLEDVARQSDQPEIHLQADNSTAYKHLTAVLAAAQRQGVRKIGIVQSNSW